MEYTTTESLDSVSFALLSVKKNLICCIYFTAVCMETIVITNGTLRSSQSTASITTSTRPCLSSRKKPLTVALHKFWPNFLLSEDRNVWDQHARGHTDGHKSICFIHAAWNGCKKTTAQNTRMLWAGHNDTAGYLISPVCSISIVPLRVSCRLVNQ